MKTCGTCKHWKVPEDLDGVAKKYPDVRLCAAAEFGGCEGPAVVPSNPRGMTVTDGSGYFAALRTRSDFGCVLHEEA